MRILIANHHLDQRAGSELYTLELGTALHRLGHQVGLFTFVTGEVSGRAEAAGLQVFTPGERAALERFNPEVAHVQHAPCLFYLATCDIAPAVLFSSLGWQGDMEAAPPVLAGVSALLAVSEEVRERLRPAADASALPLHVVPNWFNDLNLERPRLRPVGPTRHIAVVTNHLDATLKADLNGICADSGVRWTHLGIPTASVEITPELLSGFDRVVTIGRTALLAGALGIPCILYDMHGCDGLLTAETFAEVAPRNFSGRSHRARPSREALRQLLFEEALEMDVEALADALWNNHRLSQRAQTLLAIYEDALNRPSRLDAEARSHYGALGSVHAELMDQSVKTVSSTRRAWERVESLGRELSEFRIYTAKLERSIQDLESEMKKHIEAAEAARDEVASSEARNALLVQQWNDHENSLAGKSLRRIRSAKDQLLPKGARPREWVDQALDKVKRLA